MKVLHSSVLIAVLAALLGGCASMLNKNRQTIVLNSAPSGALVMVNGIERGVTPMSFNYHPDDGTEVRFDLVLDGYRGRSVVVRPSRSNAVLFADAMLLHIPYIVDHKDPAMYVMPLAEMTVDLYKAFAADMKQMMLPISGLELDAGARNNLGTYQGNRIQLNKDSPFRDLMQPEMLTGSMVSGLRDTWLDARSVRVATNKGDEAVQRAKLHLKPKINSFQADLSGQRSSVHGSVTMDLEWRFYSGLRTDSLLFSLPMRCTYHALDLRASDAVSAALSHAAAMLAESPELPGLMSGQYDLGLALSKGDQVIISTPRAIAFNGRKEMLSALVKAVVTVQTEKGHGSGFLISNDGYLITNEHVVGRNSMVTIRFEQGFSLDAQVLKTNRDFDLALLKVNATDLPALNAGNDETLMLGEELYAIGTPLDATLGQSVSRGVLSGRRELEGRIYLQTDVTINPGNSGGPLINEDGTVVGVATMKISGKGLEGLGFGVPISVAFEMLNIRLRP